MTVETFEYRDFILTYDGDRADALYHFTDELVQRAKEGDELAEQTLEELYGGWE